MIYLLIPLLVLVFLGWRVKGRTASYSIIGVREYFLFMSLVKSDNYVGIGIEFPIKLEKTEHFCTRDLSIDVWKYHFAFWVEDTK